MAERPGNAYNPLFVYGGVGLGKTHLLHAIGNRALAAGNAALYVTSETVHQRPDRRDPPAADGGVSGQVPRVDVLLIDDIQFIAGKESTQEEFFHTFNALHADRQAGHHQQRPPAQGDRDAGGAAALPLRGRADPTDIQTPDFETRAAILQTQGRGASSRTCPTTSSMLLAERVDSNVRELEGALNNLWIQAQLQKTPLTASLAK